MRPSLILAIAVSLSAGIACAGDGPTVLVTPPGPTFSAPIDIVIGHTIGAETYAAGNSSAGGQGQTVDGVACDASVPVQHIHVHLTLIADGVQHAIPLAIGTKGAEVINGGFVVDAQCFYWLHTHDASGIVHIESPNATARNLGQFFAIWGEPLTRSNIGGFQGAVTAYVDSTKYDGDLASLTFAERQQITLIVGTVPAEIPVYAFPSVF